MNRREFLRRALSLAPAAIIIPPAVSYFLPPRGGWPARMTATEVLARWAERAANPPLLIEREIWENAWRDLVVYGSAGIRHEVRMDLIGAPVQLTHVPIIEIPDRNWVDLRVG